MASGKWQVASGHFLRVLGVLFLFVGVISAERALFEAIFPNWTWLGLPLVAIGLSIAGTGFIVGVRHYVSIFANPETGLPPFTFAPLLLNLFWLFDPAVDLIRSRWLLGLSIWLVILIAVCIRKPSPQSSPSGRGGIYSPSALRERGPGGEGSGNWSTMRQFTVHCCLLVCLLLPLYWATLGREVGSADTFEFQVTAPQLGIAHPTGYPLYLLLGKLWTLLLPVQSVAMRLNIGTMIYGLFASVLVGWIVTRMVSKQLRRKEPSPQPSPSGRGSLFPPSALRERGLGGEGFTPTKNPLLGILVGVVFGLRPTFWSQAVEAEVYTLHAVFVAGALWLLWRQIAWAEAATLELPSQRKVFNDRWVFIAFWLGLSMTNHVTTVLLLPATVYLYLTKFNTQTLRSKIRALPKILVAALLPLLLYLYLPIRWQAVNGEGMGFGRFFQWVTGSRFAGALQWGAWWQDRARWGIIGRFFLQEWGWLGLLLIAIGFVYLLIHQRRFAIALLLTWAAFSFYCLNYYVPDLNVFLLPAHLTMAVALGGSVSALQSVLTINGLSHKGQYLRMFAPLTLLLLLTDVPQTFRQVDRSAPNELITWATAILNAPLAENAAILADSDKFPPLYYLQQAEGMRPDLEIMVLPDEATYRAELDRRVAQGQTVYLARFLPRLPYPMRATTPLVEIAPDQPLIDVETAEPSFVEADIGLVGSLLQLDSSYGKNVAALSLTWRQLSEQAAPSQLVYLRWAGANWVTNPRSQHPVNNSYPTAAWAYDEVVDDFYLLKKPLVAVEQTVELQIALGAAFSSAETLTWHTLKTVTLQPQTDAPLTTPVRIWRAGESLNSVDVESTSRPEKRFSILLNAETMQPQNWHVMLEDGTRLTNGCFESCNAQDTQIVQDAYTWDQGATLTEAGEYNLFVQPVGDVVRCGWFGWERERCEIGRITISGIPLPAGAVNFDDQIGLLSAEIPNPQLAPNGLFDLTLNWQALSTLEDDYTVFVQVLDENDTIVGQVDSWPVQGTYPTSQWEVGEVVRDPYQVQLGSDLASGDYRLVVGFYRLRDLRRLPVLDETGAIIEDRFVIPNLFVP